MNGLIKFVRDSFVLLIAGTIAGVLLTQYFQMKSAEREEAKKTVNDVSLLIMKRMYELERVNTALTLGSLSNAQEYFKKYEGDAIPEWNIKSIIYYQELERNFDKELADKFTSVTKEPTSNSLYYYLLKANVSIQEWKFCMEKNMFLQKAKADCGLNNCNTSSCESQSSSANHDLSALLDHGINYIKELNEAYETKYQSWSTFIYFLSRF